MSEPKTAEETPNQVEHAFDALEKFRDYGYGRWSVGAAIDVIRSAMLAALAEKAATNERGEGAVGQRQGHAIRPEINVGIRARLLRPSRFAPVSAPSSPDKRASEDVATSRLQPRSVPRMTDHEQPAAGVALKAVEFAWRSFDERARLARSNRQWTTAASAQEIADGLATAISALRSPADAVGAVSE